MILELPRLSHSAAAALSTPRRRYSAAHLVGAETVCSLAGSHRPPQELRGPRGHTRQGLYHSAQCLTCFWSKKKAARPSIRLRSSTTKKSIVQLPTLRDASPHAPVHVRGASEKVRDPQYIFLNIFWHTVRARRLPKHPPRTVDATHRRTSIVRFAHGPKISIRRLLGPQKNSNLFRGADGPKWSAAPAESCQSAAQRSPGARFMMVLDVGRRLDACAGASIGRDISVQVLSQASGLGRNPPSFAFRALWDPQAPAHAV